jgi:hypothetical protein
MQAEEMERGRGPRLEHPALAVEKPRSAEGLVARDERRSRAGRVRLPGQALKADEPERGRRYPAE